MNTIFMNNHRRISRKLLNVKLIIFLILNFQHKIHRFLVYTGNYSVTGFEMILTRRKSHYMITYYLPSSLFVVVSWTSFLIPSEDIQGRMALLVTLFLVLVSETLFFTEKFKHLIELVVSKDITPSPIPLLLHTYAYIYFLFKLVIGKYFQHDNNKLTKSWWLERNAILGYLLHILRIRSIVWIFNHFITGNMIL